MNSWKKCKASKWHLVPNEGNVEKIGYNVRENTLLAKFRNYPKVYRYHPVDIETYGKLRDSMSDKDFGKNFREVIVLKYQDKGEDYYGSEE